MHGRLGTSRKNKSREVDRRRSVSAERERERERERRDEGARSHIIVRCESCSEGNDKMERIY